MRNLTTFEKIYHTVIGILLIFAWTLTIIEYDNSKTFKKRTNFTAFQQK